MVLFLTSVVTLQGQQVFTGRGMGCRGNADSLLPNVRESPMQNCYDIIRTVVTIHIFFSFLAHANCLLGRVLEYLAHKSAPHVMGPVSKSLGQPPPSPGGPHERGFVWKLSWTFVLTLSGDGVTGGVPCRRAPESLPHLMYVAFFYLIWWVSHGRVSSTRCCLASLDFSIRVAVLLLTLSQLILGRML